MSAEMFSGFGGAQLALHRIGAGRPLILLHGLFSKAEMNWIKWGHAALLADAGFECLMPDLRAHGQSAAPHEAAAYPDDVLALDLVALITHLGLNDFDLAGFSLGSRTAVRAIIGGLRPAQLVLAGMGLQGLAGWSGRQAFFTRAIDAFGTAKPGDDTYMAQQFMKSMKVDRVAARLLLATFADTAPAELAAVTMPAAVICGDEDRDNGDPAALTAALPDAVHRVIPGTHMGCVTRPELGEAIRDFLTGTAAR
ncbi:alpha/beta fold hydrolase [Novosphingobium sp.]|uniref:alpha/beta fold hydrolase n=1 Tax=Novosphingobium sp. TaxID=1874826 RepID=UPI0025DACF62|nr:alpha/beta fold hydrolase [Novosphingobium sp.]